VSGQEPVGWVFYLGYSGFDLGLCVYFLWVVCFVVSSSAADWLERLLFEMTRYVSAVMLNLTK